MYKKVTVGRSVNGAAFFEALSTVKKFTQRVERTENNEKNNF